MFLVDPKVFRFVVKGVKAIFLGVLIPCFGSHFENGRYLENFENAELLLQW
jgi:hypothetical protein